MISFGGIFLKTVRISDIKKSYGKKKILDGVSFETETGRCVGILGSNGCGKSTLLNILAGITKKDAGEFTCDGINLLSLGESDGKVAYVPQGIPLFDELTAKENLLLWYTPKQMRKELDGGVLEMLGINDFLKVKVSKMSGGMKKRLSIGCAVHRSPEILLLDEPSAALDLVCKEKVLNYLDGFKKRGGTVIIATHDITEIEFCDSVYILKNGVLENFEYSGDIHELVEKL